MLGQYPHVQSRRIDEPDPALPREGGQNLIHIRVHEVVVAISKDAIDRSSFGNPPQELWRISRDADVARLALLLQLPQSRLACNAKMKV